MRIFRCTPSGTRTAGTSGELHSVMPTQTNADWLQQAALGFRYYWWLKVPATTAAMALFFVGYFWLLRHPVFPVTVIPVISLDRWIAFQPWSIALYASLWVYISLVPMLLQPWRELLPYLSAATLLSLAGFVIFFFWPTAAPRPEIDWARYPSVAFLKSVDAAGNACPSLHVAFSVVSGLWLERWLRRAHAPATPRIISAFWCLAIIYSTLATKQHVALDAAAGVALGLAVAMPHLYLLHASRGLRRGFEPG